MENMVRLLKKEEKGTFQAREERGRRGRSKKSELKKIIEDDLCFHRPRLRKLNLAMRRLEEEGKEKRIKMRDLGDGNDGTRAQS